MSESGSLMDVVDGVCNGETRVELEPSTSNAESTDSRENLDRNSPGTVLNTTSLLGGGGCTKQKSKCFSRQSCALTYTAYSSYIEITYFEIKVIC